MNNVLYAVGNAFHIVRVSGHSRLFSHFVEAQLCLVMFGSSKGRFRIAQIYQDEIEASETGTDPTEIHPGIFGVSNDKAGDKWTNSGCTRGENDISSTRQVLYRADRAQGHLQGHHTCSFMEKEDV